MEWLNVNSIDELKKLGKLKPLVKQIKIDIKGLFEDTDLDDGKENKMICITSNSWVGLYKKINAFKEVISKINNDEGDIETIGQAVEKHISPKSGYFKSLESEYIFYLLELDGKERAAKLKMSMKCFSNKKEAKRWRDSIAKVIHPDKCNNDKATEALARLNQLYRDMIGDD